MLRLKDPELTHAFVPTENGAIGSRSRNEPPPVRADGGPAEVRDLLKRAYDEAAVLRSERRSLTAQLADVEQALAVSESRAQRLMARVAQLERHRCPAAASGSPPDGRSIAGAAGRTALALRSGQEVAESLVERARQRAKDIEQSALEEAEQIRKRADAEAKQIVAVAQYDAEGVLQGAQASGEELLAHARQLRREAMSRFAARRAALQQEIERLEHRRLGLLKTCAAIKGPVDEAISILNGQQGAAPSAGRNLLSWWQDVSARGRAARSGARAGLGRDVAGPPPPHDPSASHREHRVPATEGSRPSRPGNGQDRS